MRHFNWRYASVFASVGAFVLSVGQADAARFQLRETNASSLGYAMAGVGAEKGDIASQFNNPALMTTVDKTGVAGSLVMIAPNLKYDVSSATYSTGAAFTGGNDGDNATPVALIPAAYMMWAVNDKMRLGLAVTSPWGLMTDYNNKWTGSFFATRSKLESVDVNPNVAFKFNDKLSVGAGFSVQYVKADLSSALSPRLAAIASAPSEINLQGKSTGFGFNLGLLFTPWSHTRFGLAYRSAVRHKLKGNMRISNRSNAVSTLGDLATFGAVGPVNLTQFNALPIYAPDGTSIRAPLTLPETAAFSVQHDFNSKWTGRLGVEWTRWKQLESLNVDVDWNPNYAGSVAPGVAALARSAQALAQTSITEPLPARNTWFYSLGASYQYSDQTTLKFGIAHDQNAQKESSVRLPDNNRIWFSFGVDQKFTDNLTASLDYTFIKVQNTDVDMRRDVSAATAGLTAARAQLGAAGGAIANIAQLSSQTFKARAKSYVNLLGVKVQYKF
ncbi:MAG: hypothetical protein C0514_00825 [Candidatus Puniceispirillum sp.]|nr:hypothetical protein [Candidatus Puniceispirillum sp.]